MSRLVQSNLLYRKICNIALNTLLFSVTNDMILIRYEMMKRLCDGAIKLGSSKINNIRRLVAGFPLRRSGFELGSSHVGPVVDRAPLGQVMWDLWWTERHWGRSCGTCGGQSATGAGHVGPVVDRAPLGQVMWDLWWTERHWGRSCGTCGGQRHWDKFSPSTSVSFATYYFH
jgi:hypothetical protein